MGDNDPRMARKASSPTAKMKNKLGMPPVTTGARAIDTTCPTTLSKTIRDLEVQGAFAMQPAPYELNNTSFFFYLYIIIQNLISYFVSYFSHFSHFYF